VAAERDRLAADRDGSAHRLYSYVARGLYAEQVTRWRGAVGDRLLVLLSDDLFRDPRQTFDRVQAFVGLDQWEPSDFQVDSPLVPHLRGAPNGFSRGFVAVIGTGRRESNGQVAG
jgi:hypothetical protein